MDVKIYLISLQLLYGAAIPAWVIVWLIALMTLDAGFHLWNVMFFSLTTLFPVVAGLCAVYAWKSLEHPRRAAMINALPLLWTALIFYYASYM